MGLRGRDARAIALAVVAVALAGCGRPSTGAATTKPADGDAGFLAPPTLTGADESPGGGVRLIGRAPGDAIVRLQSPDGRALGVTADAGGAWSLDLPASATPELFAFSAEVGGRTVRGEGALAVAPHGAAVRAAILRAGAPSLPAISGGAALALATVDFDAGGGLAVSGAARAGATLRLRIDDVAAGAGQADGAGRFGLLGVGAPLKPGPHRVRVEGPGAAAEAQVDLAPVPSPVGAPYRTARAQGGWRIDWSPPGGGEQSLVLLDAAAARP